MIIDCWSLHKLLPLHSLWTGELLSSGGLQWLAECGDPTEISLAVRSNIGENLSHTLMHGVDGNTKICPHPASQAHTHPLHACILYTHPLCRSELGILWPIHTLNFSLPAFWNWNYVGTHAPISKCLLVDVQCFWSSPANLFSWKPVVKMIF